MLSFYMGLDNDSALYLDITTGGSFAHKTTTEGMHILDCIIENTSLVLETEPLQEQESCHENTSTADFDLFLIASLAVETSPEP